LGWAQQNPTKGADYNAMKMETLPVLAAAKGLRGFAPVCEPCMDHLISKSWSVPLFWIYHRRSALL